MLASKAQLTCHRTCTTNQSPRAFGRSRTAIRPCAIGFDLTGSSESKSAEKSADQLSRAASSMLIYRGVLSSRPAQAFTDVLLHLQKGSPLKLLEHYGELYKSINNEGYSSWQDYLLDQVLRGTDNPFSKAAARGEETAHLIPSVRHDVSVIQQLSVSEATLAGWVRETVSGVSDDWIVAATSMPPSIAASNGAIESIELPEISPQHILGPLTKGQRAKLRSDLSKQQPAEAAVMLQRYHAAHDYGILSTHKVLKWSQDRLQAQDVLEGINLSTELDKNLVQTLVAAVHAGLLSLDLTKRHQGCEPIFIEGCSRKAYSTTFQHCHLQKILHLQLQVVSVLFSYLTLNFLPFLSSLGPFLNTPACISLSFALV